MADDSHLHQPLVNNHDPEASDDDVEIAWPGPPLKRQPSSKQTPRFSSRYALALAFVCVSLLSAWGGSQFHADRSLNSKCAMHTTQWSPVLRDVNIKYEPHSFNGSFMAEDIYRQVGSDEVDAAWEALGVNYRAGTISVKDGLASGLDPGFVRRSDKYGGGFLVNVEGMHHLHCLNLVRQALYFNFDRYQKMGKNAFENKDPILRLHVSHCLDTIRQVLMCNVDTSVLGQVWVDPEEPIAFPDFNTRHVCKNYDDVREWAEKLQAPPFDEVAPDYLARPEPDDVLEAIP